LSLNYFSKLKIFLKTIKIFENWYLYPLIYYGIKKSELVNLKTRTGIRILIRPNSTDIMALTNIWVLDDYSNSKISINDGDTIIDIGAHIGLFILYITQFYKNGKIFCMEPDPDNFKLLEQNLKQNQISNVFIFNTAVSKNSTKINLYKNDDESGHSIILPTSKSIEVESVTLNDILLESKISHCSLLKLDCEGAEYEIIESLSKENLKIIQNIILEYHLLDSKPNLIINLIKKLENNSFSIIKNKTESTMGILHAIKN